MSVRVGIADATDPRVLEAAATLAERGTVAPVLVGAVPGTAPTGVEEVQPAPGESSVECLARMLPHADLAAGVSGSLTSSPAVLRAGLQNLSRRGLVSGCFAVQHGGAWTTYADCVVIPEPTAEQLADIASAAADHHSRLFDVEARVAMLSFSTAGSAAHPRVALVQEATRRLRRRCPNLLVDGEVQFDVAVDPIVAARKAPDSAVEGAANVLVFPCLDAANIAYKVAERIGGSRALGSFVLGLERPWVDLSRGCSVVDIVDTVSLLAGSGHLPQGLTPQVA